MAVSGGWAVLLGVGCVICLLSVRLTRLYATLLLAFGILLWAQGNLWIGDYGILGGRTIDWDRLAGRVPYELSVWAVVFLLAALLSRSVSRFAPFTVQLFLVLQAGALAITWGGPAAERRTGWAEPPPELFQFSSERNVVHIVLDEFQSDVFVAMALSDELGWTRRTCHQGRSACKLTPLGQGGGSAVFDNVAAIEMAWVVDMGVDRGLDGGEFLQGLDVSDPSPGPCPPSKGLM